VDPGNSGVVGGWTIEVLPFLDQKNLRDRITPGVPIAAAPDFLLGQPRIFRCPIRAPADAPDATAMDHAQTDTRAPMTRTSVVVCQG
jgi:hypothetical protein